MKIAPLDRARLPAWRALFDACGCVCFCRWWHFAGTRNEWLARCSQEPESNFEEQRALVNDGASEARGLVVMDADRALGWMKLVPRACLPKLRGQGPYRRLELGPDDGVWSIGCLLVRPDQRRRGVARALVASAAEHVRAWGGRVVEAYPRRAEDAMHDEEAWMGTDRLFASCGFVEVAGEGRYPVMRNVWGAAEGSFAQGAPKL